jgi:Ribbon-helix-helix protein, copG family
MSSAVAKKKNAAGELVQFRAEGAWLARLDAEAARNGQTRSAYIRLALTEKMDKADAERGIKKPEESTEKEGE